MKKYEEEIKVLKDLEKNISSMVENGTLNISEIDNLTYNALEKMKEIITATAKKALEVSSLKIIKKKLVLNVQQNVSQRKKMKRKRF